MKLGADTHPYTTRGKPQHHESFLDRKLGIEKGSIYFLLRMRLVSHFVQVSAVKGTAGKRQCHMLVLLLREKPRRSQRKPNMKCSW